MPTCVLRGVFFCANTTVVLAKFNTHSMMCQSSSQITVRVCFALKIPHVQRLRTSDNLQWRRFSTPTVMVCIKVNVFFCWLQRVGFEKSTDYNLVVSIYCNKFSPQNTNADSLTVVPPCPVLSSSNFT